MQKQEAGMMADAAKMWWVPLVIGVIWLIISVFVLRFDTTSITTVGILLGVLFLFAAISEFMIAALVEGWKWLHIALGVLFAAGSLWAFIQPEEAFWALASVLGLLLVLMGTVYIIQSIMAKDYDDLWWLGLVAGIILVLLGFWASQQFFPARAALIILWVGLMALFRGIIDIVTAFRIRSAGKKAEKIAAA